jgi:hypothetical protein
MRSSAASSARTRIFFIRLARLLDGHFGQIADDGVHILAHIAHFGELGGLDLDEGRIGQPARRRAISVLPTPVGPIIRMFLGVISWRSPRHLLAARLRRNGHGALGACWPTMCLSSSETISWGSWKTWLSDKWASWRRSMQALSKSMDRPVYSVSMVWFMLV